MHQADMMVKQSTSLGYKLDKGGGICWSEKIGNQNSRRTVLLVDYVSGRHRRKMKYHVACSSIWRIGALKYTVDSRWMSSLGHVSVFLILFILGVSGYFGSNDD